MINSSYLITVNIPERPAPDPNSRTTLLANLLWIIAGIDIGLDVRKLLGLSVQTGADVCAG